MTGALFGQGALVVAPAFVSLWMYFVPRWIVGRTAFEGPRPLGYSFVLALNIMPRLLQGVADTR